MELDSLDAITIATEERQWIRALFSQLARAISGKTFLRSDGTLKYIEFNFFQTATLSSNTNRTTVCIFYLRCVASEKGNELIFQLSVSIPGFDNKVLLVFKAIPYNGSLKLIKYFCLLDGIVCPWVIRAILSAFAGRSVIYWKVYR